MGLMVYLFESGIFSIIFAISLRGLGEHTKTGASIMASAISGAIMLPFPQQAAVDRRGVSYSFSVTAAAFAAGTIFPLYLNLVPAAREQVDPVRDEYLIRHHHRSRHGNVVYREKANPSLGGVLSRPRSVHDEPFGSMRLRREAELHNHTTTPSGKRGPDDRDKNTSGHHHGFSLGQLQHHEPSRLRGGVMHELAPWPD